MHIPIEPTSLRRLVSVILHAIVYMLRCGLVRITHTHLNIISTAQISGDVVVLSSANKEVPKSRYTQILAVI